MKVVGSEKIFHLKDLFRSRDEIKQIQTLSQMKDLQKFLLLVGFDFALHFASVKDKILLSNSAQARDDFKNCKGTVHAFYSNRKDVEKYAKLCIYMHRVITQKSCYKSLPIELYSVLYVVDGDRSHGCKMTANWMLDNFRMSRNEKDYVASELFFVFACNFFNTKSKETYNKRPTISIIDTNDITERVLTRNYIVCDRTEESKAVLHCILDFVEYIEENYRAEATDRTYHYGHNISQLKMDMFIQWVVDNKEQFYVDAVQHRRYFVPFWYFLLWKLMVKRLLPPWNQDTATHIRLFDISNKKARTVI